MQTPRRVLTCLAASAVLAQGLLIISSDEATALPAELKKKLVLQLEADSGVELDPRKANPSSGLAPAVRLWQDLAQGRQALANASIDANLRQRRLHEKADRTRHTHKTWSLPMAKLRASSGLPDSAPALIKDPDLGVPALFFDGDDYLKVPLKSSDDALVPGSSPMTVVCMLKLAAPEKGQNLTTYRWLGVGSPAEFGVSQMNFETVLFHDEDADGKIRTEATAVVRVVPTMHDKDVPSIRKGATIEAPVPIGKPVIISFVLTGHSLNADIDGDRTKWIEEEGGLGGEKDGWNYEGGINPIADTPDASFQVGAAPASERIYTGEGAFGTLYGAMVFKSLLGDEARKSAEKYLACKFNLKDRCKAMEKKRSHAFLHARDD